MNEMNVQGHGVQVLATELLGEDDIDRDLRREARPKLMLVSDQRKIDETKGKERFENSNRFS